MAEIMQRDKTLDGLKFLLIVLVIVGHAIEPTRYSNVISGGLYSIIYSFHMPLFVLLSGYFSKSIDLHKINRQARALIETYLIMALFIGFTMGYGFQIVLSPSLSCWYLLSLIFWRYLLYLCVDIFRMKKTVIIGFSILVSVAFFFLPIDRYYGVLSIMRTSQFFVFFAIGYSINDELIFKLRNSSSIKFCLRVIAIILFIIIAKFSSRGIHLIEFHRETLSGLMLNVDWSIVECILYNCAMVLANIIICASFLSIKKLPRVFSKLGVYSLLFFFLQGILVHKTTLMLPNSLLMEVFLSIIVILLGIVLIPIQKWLTNPVTSLIIYYKNDKQNTPSIS